MITGVNARMNNVKRAFKGKQNGHRSNQGENLAEQTRQTVC